MELFDPGHLASGLGDLDAVGGEDGPAVHAKNAGVGSEEEIAPGAGELVQIQGWAVEEVQEAVVAGRLQAQGAHDAGDAQQVFASGDSRQAKGHPQEGPGPAAPSSSCRWKPPGKTTSGPASSLARELRMATRSRVVSSGVIGPSRCSLWCACRRDRRS